MLSRSVSIVLLVLLTANVAWSQDSGDEQLILEARARSNAGIASQDLPVVMAEIDSLYQITGGYSGFLTSHDDMADIFKAEFEASPPVIYVRTPKFVEVSQSGKRAFESGIWEGGESGADPELTYGGRYAAHWVKKDEGWKIRSEVFVSLFSNQ